jgi:hypothetical protein
MDGFAQCILQSCAFAASLDSLQAAPPRPGWRAVADVGRRLEDQGRLQAEVGDNYALAVMACLAGTGSAL